MKRMTEQRFLMCMAIALMTVFSFKAAASSTYYYFQAKVSASPSGAGKVYVSKTATGDPTLSESSTTGTFSASEAKQTVHLYAAPNEGYKFLRWTKGSMVVGSNRNIQAVITSASKDEANPAVSNFTANFVKAKVTVRSQDDKYCKVAIDKEENDVGDMVTLTATMISNYINPVGFAGWSLNGEIVSRDPVYSVQVTGDAEYTATFATVPHSLASGMYCRVKSKKKHKLKYVSVIGTSFREASKSTEGFWGAICDKSIILVPDDDAVFSDAGTVVYISGTQDGEKVTDASLKAQGVGSKDLQNYASLSLWYDDGYLLAGNLSGSRYFKHGGSFGYPCMLICGGDDKNDVRYDIEPVDEEHIDTYYFGATPSAGTTDGERYYTTMYTAFPYQCHDGVKAYIVDAVTGDKVHLLEIEDGRVPANTPVVLQCKGTTARENRLVPIVDHIPDPIPGCDTWLKGKIDINDGNGEESFRTAFDASTMRVLSADELKFVSQNNGGETYIKTNTCYLQADNLSSDSYTLSFDRQSLTLARLADQGKTGECTVIGNGLKAVDQFETPNGDKYLVVTDEDDSYIANWVDVNSDANRNARQYAIEGHTQLDYTQCNWLLVKCADGGQYNMMGQAITSITGNVTDAVNPTMEATEIVGAAPFASSWTINTYCPVNFMTTAGDNLVHTGENVTSAGDYFFMTPKPCELANMVYCVPSADKTAFCVPVKADGANGHDFAGGVRINWDYNRFGDVSRSLDSDASYVFKALVKMVSSPAGSPAVAPKEGDLSSRFVVYPLNMDPENLITGVNDVTAGKTVTSVRYYNLQGMESDRLHKGLNVVVTTYSDGSRKVKKLYR